MIFFAAAGLLLVSLIYRLMNPYVQPRVDTLTYTGRSSDSKKIKAEPGDDRVVADPFARSNGKAVSGKVYKDLFALYKPPQTAGQEKQSIGKKDRQLEITPPYRPVTKDPVLAIKEYIASYKFYGSYDSAGKKAVFLAKNKLVLVARTGDRIDGKYEIEDIQDDFIRIKATDLNQTIDINIREFNDD
jgi:hypothetical protein